MKHLEFANVIIANLVKMMKNKFNTAISNEGSSSAFLENTSLSCLKMALMFNQLQYGLACQSAATEKHLQKPADGNHTGTTNQIKP